MSRIVVDISRPNTPESEVYVEVSTAHDRERGVALLQRYRGAVGQPLEWLYFGVWLQCRDMDLTTIVVQAHDGESPRAALLTAVARYLGAEVSR